MNEIDISKIPFGADHAFDCKLRWAKRLYDSIGKQLLSDTHVSNLLKKYKECIYKTWEAMQKAGVVRECTRCALQDGGSCCGSGIENKFDVINLLINLLYGVNIPEKPFDPTGCWFLGENGCLIFARHVICVNFMCKRLYSVLNEEDIKKVQKAMEKETEAAFILEEYIKVWLLKNV